MKSRRLKLAVLLVTVGSLLASGRRPRLRRRPMPTGVTAQDGNADRRGPLDAGGDQRQHSHRLHRHAEPGLWWLHGLEHDRRA